MWKIIDSDYSAADVSEKHLDKSHPVKLKYNSHTTN